MPSLDKKSLSERDICTKFITPALVDANWDVMDQIREEVSFTKGRVIVRGKISVRGDPKRADYVLSHKPGIPIAIVEAKDNNHSVGAAMQQALEYATTLDVPFVFSSNGDAFIFHNRTGQSQPVESELPLNQFPSPEDLWQRYCTWKGITPAQTPVVEQNYHPAEPGKELVAPLSMNRRLRPRCRRFSLSPSEEERAGVRGPFVRSRFRGAMREDLRRILSMNRRLHTDWLRFALSSSEGERAGVRGPFFRLRFRGSRREVPREFAPIRWAGVFPSFLQYHPMRHSIIMNTTIPPQSGISRRHFLQSSSSALVG